MSTTGQDLFYFVDPGLGEKGPGCPYSFYKDGRDVRAFITPPPGYELTDFKLEPYPEDKFYDGKIVAQYSEIPVSNKLSSFVLKHILPIAFIIAILTVLAFFIYNNLAKSKPAPQNDLKPKTEVKAADTVVQKQVSDTTTNAEVITNEEPVSNEISTEEVVENQEVQNEVIPTENIDVIKNEKAEITLETKADANPAQEPQQAETLTKEQFQQEFWSLIHHQESRMQSYGNLFRKYKSQDIKSKEFIYLSVTILENTTAFGEWKNKLVRIPENEIKSINTITALKEKLEEFE